MGNALFLSTDATLALPRYYDFSSLDPFVATDGTAGSDGLDDVTTLIYDPQYRDVKLSFHVVDPTTYYGSPGSPVTLTLRVNDTHPLQVVSQVNYTDPDPAPDGRTDIVLTLLQSGSTVDSSQDDHRSDSIFPTRNLSGYWVLQVVQDLLTLEMTPATNTDGTAYPTVSLSARLVPDTAGSISTSSVFMLAFADSVTLTDLAMDYPTLLSSEVTPSSTRQPRTARATATDFVVTSAAAIATSIRTQRTGALAATATNVNVHAAMAQSTRSRRTGVISLSYPPPPEDDESATLASTRAPRVASATGTSVVVTPDPATAASVRSPRAAAATGRVLDATGLLQVSGTLTQDQYLETPGLVVLLPLAGAVVQYEALSGPLSFLHTLSGSLEQACSASALLTGLGRAITPSSPGFSYLAGIVTQGQSLHAILTPTSNGYTVVSGVSPNTPGQVGDPGWPGIGTMTPREYDIRDGEHKPTTETGFSRRRDFERAPTNTYEQVWPYPGPGSVGILSTPYRTLRHSGVITELAYSTGVASTGVVSIGLYADDKLVATMDVPANRVQWSVPLEYHYDIGQKFTCEVISDNGNGSGTSYGFGGAYGFGYGPTRSDTVIHAFFKQTNWTRGPAYSQA